MRPGWVRALGTCSRMLGGYGALPGACRVQERTVQPCVPIASGLCPTHRTPPQLRTVHRGRAEASQGGRGLRVPLDLHIPNLSATPSGGPEWPLWRQPLRLHPTAERKAVNLTALL